MKRLLICLLLVGVVGCGRPETEQQAYVALKKLGANIERNDDGHIVYLGLDGKSFTDADLAHLKPLKRLEILGLTDGKISGAGLVNLRDLATLKEVYLGGSTITDAGLKHLRRLPSLEFLTLGFTQLTERSLVHLTGMTTLKELTLPYQISATGVAELQKALPECSIYQDTPPETTIPGTGKYPQKAITLVIPFAPGGESDFFGRELQKAIRDHRLLPQDIVIQNVKGAGGTIGVGRVRRHYNDGYTMLLMHEAIITAQSSGHVWYGPEDFEPIAATGKFNMVIAVQEDSPYQTLTDLMKAAKAQPKKLVFAANLNMPVHYAGLILESTEPGASFRYTQIGGGAHRFEALIGGHADVSAFYMGEFMDYRSAGLRALAISAAERHPELPTVMTAVEQGYDFVHADMHFWWFPKGTNQAKIDYMATVISKAMATEQVHQALAKRLCQPLVKTGSEMKATLAEQIKAIRSVDATENNPKGELE